MPSEDELKFFGMLVLKGHLNKEDVLKCLKASEAVTKKGHSLSLGEIAVRLKIMSRERLDFFKRSGGEALPDMAGYKLAGKIGEGGTSNVFRFLEEKTGEYLAVKILKDDQAAIESVKRSFVREAKLLIQLDHTNIVKGLRIGTVKGHYVFFMEHIEGDDLQDLLRKGMTFNEDAALYIILQAARAIEYMRGQGILHRDIKPGNIMLKRDNTVKLIDLGFATIIGEQKGGLSDSTQGTVQYISPEQAQGKQDLDVRSDIYSLGATLYQLVVGNLPFSGSDDQAILAKQILESLSSPALKERGKISPYMHYFIEKMMAKERDIRYQSPNELIEHIEDTIRGKKTLTYRPDIDALEEDGFIDAPYTVEEEKDDKNSRSAGREKGKGFPDRKGRRRFRR
jgi:serine/threonine-protein kinase